MKTILFMATSVNGYVARENGQEDFISHESWESFCNLAKECGCFVIGRKTYEVVKSWNDETYNFDSIIGVQKVIVSANSEFTTDEDYIIANSPNDAVEKLSGKGFEKMLVVGGATNNSSFMRAGLVDEIVLSVEPFVLGSGIPIFSKEDFGYSLELIDIKQKENGLVQLHYKVKK
ncbi:MAG: Bifunctional deaminase-reductase protein [uncultured bacterium]|nr:MAG: Bifunctional deaminase-reductase protein [uncultured bacterium]